MNDTETKTIHEQDLVPACRECVNRSRLITLLSGHLNKAYKEGEDNPDADRYHDMLAASDEQMARALAGESAEQVLKEARDYDLSDYLESLGDHGVWAICRHSIYYPKQLNDLGTSAPAVLFCRGNGRHLKAIDAESTVSLVGARRATRYGLEMARTLAAELSARAITVVTGLSLGIEGSVVRGTLELNGLPVVVLACGPDRPYPVSHIRMYRNVIDQGLILSEMPPGAAPEKWSIAARGRIIAALSSTTVVIEAAKNSGALRIVEEAVELDRQIGAVPGQVTSKAAEGTNELIAGGAQLVRGIDDLR